MSTGSLRRNKLLDAPRVNHRTRAPHGDSLPTVSPFLLRGFQWYVRRYMRKHFNAVRLAKGAAPAPADTEAVICYANHPGWWDPLLAFYMHQRFFPGRTLYAPIDQSALDKYPVFRRLGFYGIELDSLEGARRFLTITRELLQRPTTAIWITPGGAFSDVRKRTVLQPGLAHLAARMNRVTFLPVAVEYTFWEERTPEALAEFGPPLHTQPGDNSKESWRTRFEEALAATQASLATRVISRDADQFDTLLDGAAGVGGPYDLFRQAASWLRGQGFNPRHRQPG